MDRLEYDVSAQPTLIIENASGDLRVKSWNRQQIRADADGRNCLTAKQDGDTILLKCLRDSYLRVPDDTTIEFRNVSGDCFVKSVEGDINISHISGSMSLKDVGNVTIEEVMGNLSVRVVEGNLSVGQVHGNADLRDIDGQAKLESVHGNLSARGELLGLQAEVGGNVFLRLDPDPDGSYEINAGGAIQCRLLEDASAVVEIHSNAGVIKLKTNDYSGVLKKENETITLADGEADIKLSAGGKVYFKLISEESNFEMGFDFELGDDFIGLAEGITDQVTSQIEGQMEALSQKLSNLNFGSMGSGSSRVKATIRREEHKVEAAQRRLERRAAAAQRKAERKNSKSHRHQQHKHTGKFVGISKIIDDSDPVGEDERRMVLEMVQSNKISVEEAEILLTSMEGSSPGIEFPQKMPTPPAPPQPPKPPASPQAEKKTTKAKKPKTAKKKAAKKKKDSKS